MGAGMPDQRFLWELNDYQRKSQNFQFKWGANANLVMNFAILRNPMYVNFDIFFDNNLVTIKIIAKFLPKYQPYST